MVIFGTRPEAIKLCPLIKELKNRNDFKTIVCTTGQHIEMLEEVLNLFNVHPDYHLTIMTQNQTLFDITNKALSEIKNVLHDSKPDLVIVQGDTTTAYAAALAAFYLGIPVGHVEAGLRTDNIFSPFPEEFNRKSISLISSYDFAPTKESQQVLLKEGKSPDFVFNYGNTVIDAMIGTINQDWKHLELDWLEDSPFILMTVHRRETLGDEQRHIFRAVRRVLDEHPEIKALFPIHKNPKVREVAYEEFASCENIHIIETLNYVDFHNFESRCTICVTDSGGIQEECSFLGKPTLVVRDHTERSEGVNASVLRLVGTNEDTIYSWLTRLLTDPVLYKNMARPSNVFGDGTASNKIARKISEILQN